jgi:hypothetical protein
MFRQGNLEQFEAMLEAIEPFIIPKSTVCELYAGAGIIGLSTAAGKCEWLRCVCVCVCVKVLSCVCVCVKVLSCVCVCV